MNELDGLIWVFALAGGVVILLEFFSRMLHGYGKRC